MIISGRYLAQYRATSSPEREQRYLKRFLLPEAKTHSWATEFLRQILGHKPELLQTWKCHAAADCWGSHSQPAARLRLQNSRICWWPLANLSELLPLWFGQCYKPPERELMPLGTQASCLGPSCVESSIFMCKAQGPAMNRGKGKLLVNISSLRALPIQDEQHKKALRSLGCVLEQWKYDATAWRWACFSSGVGLDDPQRSLPTPTILWFFQEDRGPDRQSSQKGCVCMAWVNSGQNTRLPRT